MKTTTWDKIAEVKLENSTPIALSLLTDFQGQSLKEAAGSLVWAAEKIKQHIEGKGTSTSGAAETLLLLRRTLRSVSRISALSFLSLNPSLVQEPVRAQFERDLLNAVWKELSDYRKLMEHEPEEFDWDSPVSSVAGNQPNALLSSPRSAVQAALPSLLGLLSLNRTIQELKNFSGNAVTASGCAGSAQHPLAVTGDLGTEQETTILLRQSHTLEGKSVTVEMKKASCSSSIEGRILGESGEVLSAEVFENGRMENLLETVLVPRAREILRGVFSPPSSTPAPGAEQPVPEKPKPGEERKSEEKL